MKRFFKAMLCGIMAAAMLLPASAGEVKKPVWYVRPTMTDPGIREEQTTISYRSEGLTAVQREADGLWGFIDRQGELAIQYAYAQVYPFSEGYAAVQPEEGGLWGYIDKTGKMAIEPRFSIAESFSEGYARVKGEGENGILDALGHVIPVETESVKDWSIGGFSCGVMVHASGDYFGAIDKSGKFVIPAKFDILEPCSEGLLVGKIGNQYGIYDTSGELVMEWEPPTKEYELPLYRAEHNHLAAMVREKTPDGGERALWGYIYNPLATPSSWASAYIEKARYITPDRLTYDYQKPITREEYASLIAHTLERRLIEKLFLVSDAATFTDTASYGVRLLHALGVVEGTSEGTFGPDEPLTREQAAWILSRSAAYMGLLASPRAEVPVYADHASISQGAVKSVEDVSVMGLMQGTERGFEPQAPFTREQAITTALRLFELGE